MIEDSIGNSFAGKMPCPDTVLMVGATFQKHLALSSGFIRGVGLSCVDVALPNSVFKVRLALSPLFTPRCHKRELTLPGTLIAVDFPVGARRDLLRDEFGAILTGWLAQMLHTACLSQT